MYHRRAPCGCIRCILAQCSLAAVATDRLGLVALRHRCPTITTITRPAARLVWAVVLNTATAPRRACTLTLTCAVITAAVAARCVIPTTYRAARTGTRRTVLCSSRAGTT